MTYSEHVAAEIRARMARLGANRTTTALNAGMTDDTFGRRIRGEIPFNIDELHAVAAALDTTPIAILTDVDDNTPKD